MQYGKKTLSYNSTVYDLEDIAIVAVDEYGKEKLCDILNESERTKYITINMDRTAMLLCSILRFLDEWVILEYNLEKLRMIGTAIYECANASDDVMSNYKYALMLSSISDISQEDLEEFAGYLTVDNNITFKQCWFNDYPKQIFCNYRELPMSESIHIQMMWSIGEEYYKRGLFDEKYKSLLIDRNKIKDEIKPPLVRHLLEHGTTRTCGNCGSSIKLHWLLRWKSVGCIHPECANYHENK